MNIAEGVVFRRVEVKRRRQRPKELADARWGDEDAEGAAMLVTYTVGDTATRQGVTGIYRRVALAATAAGLLELDAAAAALSTHSLHAGLTHDLFAASEDGRGVALHLRWSSPSIALRYGRQLRVQSGIAAVFDRECDPKCLIPRVDVMIPPSRWKEAVWAGSSRERHDNARRPSSSDAAESLARDTEPGLGDQP